YESIKFPHVYIVVFRKLTDVSISWMVQYVGHAPCADTPKAFFEFDQSALWGTIDRRDAQVEDLVPLDLQMAHQLIKEQSERAEQAVFPVKRRKEAVYGLRCDRNSDQSSHEFVLLVSDGVEMKAIRQSPEKGLKAL